MTENSENKKSVDKAVKKTPAKKTAVKKTAAKPKVSQEETSETKVNDEYVIIVFETGTAFISGDYHFTKDNRIRKIKTQDAAKFLELENFRLADQIEIEEFLASEEN